MHFDVNKRFELWYERLTLPRAVATVISVAFILVLVAGALQRIVEPEVYTDLGTAYYWAVVTVTTVGYGDVVPVTLTSGPLGMMINFLPPAQQIEWVRRAEAAGFEEIWFEGGFIHAKAGKLKGAFEDLKDKAEDAVDSVKEKVQEHRR